MAQTIRFLNDIYYSALNSTGATANTSLCLQTSTGRVGIGTASPAYLLDIGGFASSAQTLRIGATSSNACVRIMEASDAYGFSMENIATAVAGASGARMDIVRHSASVQGTPIMSFIRDNPYVGIGITNPGYTLQVNGSIGMVGGTTIPVTLPAVGSQTSYSISLPASGAWYTVITDARINATITGAIGASDLTSTIFIATLYASGGANASMALVTGSATNIRVSGTALQFWAVSGLYGLNCNFTLLRHN